MSADKLAKVAGHPNLTRAGRKPGATNKITRSAKEAYALAFDGLGGAAALQKWAMENLGEFYKLHARLIPTEVAGENGGAVVIRVIRDE